MARALNVRTIDAIKPHKTKRQELPDGTVTGLYLVVQSSGAKSWAVRYRYAGKPAKLTLGPWPRLGLAEARAAARETLGIVSEGNDPTADQVTLKRLKRGPVVEGNRTFEAVKKRFIESQRAKGRRTVAVIEAILDRDATPHWKNRQITSITAADVVERIEVIVARGAPVAAARFRAWVSKLFGYAVKAQLCPDNPVRLTESPVDAKSRERKRRLDDKELVLVWKTAEQIGYPYGSAVQMLILTGQRRSEVCSAPRSEFDLSARQWIIAPSRVKNGREHLVPLSTAACDLAARLPIVGDGGFVFTTNGTQPITGFSEWKAKLDSMVTELNGGKALPHWVLHDLRRTFASGLARLRIPSEVIERAINHTSGNFAGVSGIYNRFEYGDERREAMETWARYVMAVVDGKPPQNVVPLRPVA
jgi:integrase